MLGRLGVPELMIVLVMSVFWLLPVVAAVWALLTLHRIRGALDGIRAGQQAMQMKVESIERRLQGS
jgi:hypothetical protein